jgi:Tol biopolymer transport system component
MATRPIVFAAIGLFSATILCAAPPSASAGATRIITREGARKIVAVPPSGGHPGTLLRLQGAALLSIDASGNGGDIAFASRSWDKSSGVPVWTDQIWTMRMHGGRPAHVIRSFVSSGRSRANISIDSIAVSPDGRHILVTKRAGAVFVLRADGSHFRRVVVPGYSFEASGGRNSSGAEFTPDGRRIIATFRSTGSDEPVNGIGTTSVNGGRVHLLRTGPFRAGLGFASAPTVSRDGRLIAFATADHAGARIMIMNRDGTNAHRLAGSQVAGWTARNPCFSPSGNALTFSGERLSAGGVVIGVAPAYIFTIHTEGTHRRVIQREKAHRGARNPIWTRWPY